MERKEYIYPSKEEIEKAIPTLNSQLDLCRLFGYDYNPNGYVKKKIKEYCIQILGYDLVETIKHKQIKHTYISESLHGDISQQECLKHGMTDFVYSSSTKRWRCKKCRAESVIMRRRNIKEKAVEYKGSKCEICGYNKCIDALEFHHLDPSKKEFGIGYKGYVHSWEEVKNELDKCICLCANCHRELHAKNNYKNKK